MVRGSTSNISEASAMVKTGLPCQRYPPKFNCDSISFSAIELFNIFCRYIGELIKSRFIILLLSRYFKVT